MEATRAALCEYTFPSSAVICLLTWTCQLRKCVSLRSLTIAAEVDFISMWLHSVTHDSSSVPGFVLPGGGAQIPSPDPVIAMQGGGMIFVPHPLHPSPASLASTQRPKVPLRTLNSLNLMAYSAVKAGTFAPYASLRGDVGDVILGREEVCEGSKRKALKSLWISQASEEDIAFLDERVETVFIHQPR